MAEPAGRPIGPYVIQAQIAACHARAATADETDWAAIAGWYDVLARVGDNPVVEVNRAVAHGRASGPEAGLAVLDAVAGAPGAGRAPTWCRASAATCWSEPGGTPRRPPPSPRPPR